LRARLELLHVISLNVAHPIAPNVNYSKRVKSKRQQMNCSQGDTRQPHERDATAACGRRGSANAIGSFRDNFCAWPDRELPATKHSAALQHHKMSYAAVSAKPEQLNAPNYDHY
jgi:hypothetical protein